MKWKHGFQKLFIYLNYCITNNNCDSLEKFIQIYVISTRLTV